MNSVGLDKRPSVVNQEMVSIGFNEILTSWRERTIDTLMLISLELGKFA